MPARDVDKAAREAGVSMRTLRRHAKRRGIEWRRGGFQGVYTWFAAPPPSSPETPTFPNRSNLSPFPETGNLGTVGERLDVSAPDQPVHLGADVGRDGDQHRRTFEEMASSFCDTCGSSTVRQRKDGLWRHAKCEPVNPAGPNPEETP